MRTGPTSTHLKNLISELKKKSFELDVKLWKRVAKDLEKPSRQRRKVNLYTINKVIRKDEIALVPGKVLSIGELEKPVTIAALNFSENALAKINLAKGKSISIEELLKTNPKGSKVRILG